MIKDNNQRFLQILADYLNFFERSIEKADVLAVQEVGCDAKTAFCHLLAALFEVDAYEKDRGFFNDYFIPSVERLDVKDYVNDPYYKAVAFDGREEGGSKLCYQTCAPYQGFVRDDFLYEDDGRVIPRIGFFEEEYRYPAVLTDGREWMTLLPNEINSQKRYIEEARGKVLTYGLGLGYYVFHAAAKDEVESVTVVDVDENVISLFKKHILCKFPEGAQKKVRIIKADAFEYAKTLKNGDYDYIYADIWHDCADGKDMYLKFKGLEKFCTSARYGYWIEESIKYYLDEEN